jgi:hypothetical protein
MVGNPSSTFSWKLDSTPNPEFEKVGDGYAVLLLARFQHPVKKAGEHVRYGSDSLGCAECGAQPEELGSPSALTSEQSRGRQP